MTSVNCTQDFRIFPHGHGNFSQIKVKIVNNENLKTQISKIDEKSCIISATRGGFFLSLIVSISRVGRWNLIITWPLNDHLTAPFRHQIAEEDNAKDG